MPIELPVLDRAAPPTSASPASEAARCRIILADPPALDDDYDKAYPNLGLLQLISYVRDRTALTDDDIVFLDQFHTIEDHLRAIEEHQPQVYGLSFAFLTQRIAYATINAIKAEYPELIVVCGGPHPSSAAEDVMERTRADIVCIGEGEQVLAELVTAVGRGDRDFSHIPGLLVRGPEGVVETGKPRALHDLDELPFLAWDRIDFSRYIGQHYCRSDKQAGIVVSRGCPYHCTFCSLPVWRAAKPNVRMRSPESIAREVDWLYELGVREIKIVSDEVNVTLPWAKDLCRAIIALGHRDLYFQSNLRADKVDDELAELFGEMNMWLVHLGVESANNRVLKGIEKHVTVEQIERCLVLLKRHNVRCLLFMMAFQLWEEDGELRWERPREIWHSLWWSWRQFLAGRVAYMTWSIATPMPGAPLQEIVQRHGLPASDEVLANWNANKDYLGIDLSSLGISRRCKMRLLRAGILSKGVFAMKSGHFDWRRNFYRFGILLRSFLGRWGKAAQPATPTNAPATRSLSLPLLRNTPLRAKVEG